MEREILFRGKRIDTGEFVEGSLIGNDVIVGKIIEFEEDYFCTEFWNKVDPETVGQLWMRIGDLKLFDGDIFDFPEYKVRYVIQYIQNRFQFCIAHPDELNLKYMDPWHCPDQKWIETFMKDAVLVGNIHDNPELL